LIKVAILRSNSIISDTRVKKIFESLSKKYSVLVLGWNREGQSIATSSKYKNNLRLLNIKAPYGKPSIIGYYPFFWIWTFLQLVLYSPKIVHACDLDTIPPAFLYKLVFRKKVIFDVFDRYAMSYINPNFYILYSFIQYLEEFYARKSDVLVTVGTKLLETFKHKPRIYSIIMNCPEDTMINTKSNGNGNLFKIVYTGNIVRSRGIKNIIEATKDLTGVEFIFAGRINEKAFLDENLNVNNVHYNGILSADDALKLEGHGDAIAVLYDLKIPINNFAMPNKIFIAMMFGTPTITNIATDIIEEAKCGILVDYDSIDQIKNAIIRLRDDKELRDKLGNNGRKAFLQKYNWQIMEKKLYRIYDDLINSN
jgi:glycosyltransferase involved in cell wall biosynthesis